MNDSIVSGPDRIIVKAVRPLPDVRHPEIQTPEPVEVGEHGGVETSRSTSGR